jgi:hypothetical protein
LIWDCAVDLRFAWAASEKEARAALTKKLKIRKLPEEARAALTKKLKIRKLPEGTELWPEDGN